MDFFGSQDRARSRTKVLVALYFAAICSIIVLIYLVAVVAGFGNAVDQAVPARGYSSPPSQNQLDFFNPGLLGTVAGLVILVIGGASLFKIKTLGSSGEKVARSVGGRAVDPFTTDPDERKLLNIVEEMSIASGVPMPDVFILENEQAINAFAAGYDVDDAAIGVTKGAVQQLSRDELQGVIAHEFSHILSGDMRLNIRLIGPLFGLLVIAFLGRMFLYSGGRRTSSNNNNGGVVILGLAIMIIGYIGVFFGRLIQAAISRQREYLADASAVQFTRNPEGIANALRRLGFPALGSKVRHEHAEDTAHLFFASALGSSLATHPPLPKRIRAILPNWDGSFLPPRKEAAPRERSDSSPAQPASAVGGSGRGMITAATAVAAIGGLSQEGIREGIESKIRIHRAIGDFAFSDPASARSLFTALILDEDAGKRKEQLDLLEEGTQETEKLFDKICGLSAADRFALMELCCSGLRRTAESDRRQLMDILQTLADADHRLSLREALVLHVVRSQVALAHDPHHRKQKSGSIKDVGKVAPETASLLYLVATVSNEETEDARAAFNEAVKSQHLLSGKLSCPDKNIRLRDLEKILGIVSKTEFGVRKQILEAASSIVLADEVASEREWTLLRLISLSLGAPMPPVLPS